MTPDRALAIVKPSTSLVRSVGIAAAVLIGLAGCTAYDTMVGEKNQIMICPRISVVADTVIVTKFRPGPGRDLTDVVIEGEITALSLECKRSGDVKGGTGQIDVAINIVMEAERGAADRERRGALEYFVGIADKDRNILQRQVFTTSASFTGNVTRVQVTDKPIDLKIPLKAGQTPDDYEILVGFQLSRDELELNRRRSQTAR